MYIQSVTYTDFDGTERTEKFYFNLTKAELMRYSMAGADNTADRLQDVRASKRVNRLMDEVENLVRRAYGERKPDGSFVKNKEISDAFMASEAYSQMLMDFLNDDGTRVKKFVEGIMPPDVMREIELERAREEKENGVANKIIDFPPQQ